MSTYEELAAEGYMKLEVMIYKIAEGTVAVHPDTVRTMLQSRLPKVRSLLVVQRDIVQPDNFKWQCVYSADLWLKLVAYFEWHRFGSRRSVAQCVEFLLAFQAREKWAVAYLPKNLRKHLDTSAKVIDLSRRSKKRTA